MTANVKGKPKLQKKINLPNHFNGAKNLSSDVSITANLKKKKKPTESTPTVQNISHQMLVQPPISQKKKTEST